MRLNKAVITAAGPSQNQLPLQHFVDTDGQEKTALQILIEEVVPAGVEKIAVVVQPGDQAAYAEAAGHYEQVLTFVEQPQPRGYGEALFRAADFVGDDAFVHLVSDHLYLSSESRRCTEQLVAIARSEDCPVSAVQATRETMLPYYGTVGGRRVEGRSGLYVIEKSARETHADGSGTAVAGSRTARGSVPVFVWPACADARSDADPG